MQFHELHEIVSENIKTVASTLRTFRNNTRTSINLLEGLKIFKKKSETFGNVLRNAEQFHEHFANFGNIREISTTSAKF